MKEFPKKSARDLHFKNLSHDQKVYASRALSAKPLGICVIASDKESLLDADTAMREKFKEKGHLYNYLIRLLLERVTDVCAKKAPDAKVHVTFSRRGGTDYQSMRDYFLLLQARKNSPGMRHRINWNVFSPEDIKVENHKVRAGLQLADLATSATYKAFEPNIYGDTEQRYLSVLSGRFIKKNGRVPNYGLMVAPYNNSNKHKCREIFTLFGDVNKKVRVPGS